MATAQMTRPQTGWSTVFPTEQVTEQQSALFVKKLLAVAVSNITYLRAIFPEHAFGDRCLEDLTLKILRDDSLCPGACQVIRWVKGCFDALEKKYLKTLIIGLYMDPNAPETVIESYTFKFTYGNNSSGIDIYRNDKQITSANSAAETKKATIRLLRTIIILTNSLQSLPDDVIMTMKLLYYDEVTPEDYEPPGFKAAECDTFTFEDEPVNINIGDVATPFHTVKLRIKTDAKQFDEENDDDTKMDEQPANVSPEKMEEHSPKASTATPATAAAFVAPEVPAAPAAPTTAPDAYEFADENEDPNDVILQFSNKSSQQKENIDPMNYESQVLTETQQSNTENMDEDYTQNTGVRCPCGYNEDDGLMILCAKCNLWQHGVCFKILDETQAPSAHYCDLCAQNLSDRSLVTDPYLCPLSPLSVQATCLWRRALFACTEGCRVVAPKLAKRLGVQVAVAQGLIMRLEKEGCLKNASKTKRQGKLVQKDKLVENMKIYFNRDIHKTLSLPDQGMEINKRQEDVKTEFVEPVVEREPVLEPVSAVEIGQGDQMEKLSARTESLKISRSKLTGKKNKEKVQKRTDDQQQMNINYPEKPERSVQGSKHHKDVLNALMSQKVDATLKTK
ncbi:uncharacterized protein LOC141913053, partial [Tubulanus polymorphus]|uniref:uncharacterized protein LOC141913053 n=1 Tax=Tubulanus polymorphus TaxID=672921 RepID=UPI003DA5DE3D